MLIWLDNAPVFGVDKDKDEDVVAYIDHIITCRKPESDPELQDLVNRQTHQHSHTCRKKSKNICRFNYPRPPIRCTQFFTLLIVIPLQLLLNLAKSCGRA